MIVEAVLQAALGLHDEGVALEAQVAVAQARHGGLIEDLAEAELEQHPQALAQGQVDAAADAVLHLGALDLGAAGAGRAGEAVGVVGQVTHQVVGRGEARHPAAEAEGAAGAYRTAFSDAACLKMILDWRGCA